MKRSDRLPTEAREAMLRDVEDGGPRAVAALRKALRVIDEVELELLVYREFVAIRHLLQDDDDAND